MLRGDLTTVTELMYLRVPALNALFPSYRGSVMDSLSSIIHDDGFWVTADIYPRYTCDYGTRGCHRHRRTSLSRSCTTTAETPTRRC